MSNKDFETGPVNVSFTERLDIRFLKSGQHSLIIPIPDDLVALIGHVAVQWGAFDYRLNVITEHFIKLLRKKPPRGWRKQPFVKRKKLFKDVSQEYTAQMFPDSSQLFREIADTAASLHIKRNVIVHGYIEIKGIEDASSPTGGSATFVAHGVHKRKPISYQLTEDFLQEVKHDISHLSGNMMAEINRMGGRLISGGPEIVVPDTDLLQDPQSGNFRTLAMQAQSKHPPQSSEE